MKMVVMHIILKKLEGWGEKRSQGKKKEEGFINKLTTNY
jgi:hypothetical protein